jgi:hypothetical protein
MMALVSMAARKRARERQHTVSQSQNQAIERGRWLTLYTGEWNSAGSKASCGPPSLQHGSLVCVCASVRLRAAAIETHVEDTAPRTGALVAPGVVMDPELLIGLLEQCREVRPEQGASLPDGKRGGWRSGGEEKRRRRDGIGSERPSVRPRTAVRHQLNRRRARCTGREVRDARMHTGNTHTEKKLRMTAGCIIGTFLQASESARSE